MKTSDKLASFRRQCERQSGKDVADLEVPLLFVLHDLCQLLKLSKTAEVKVLGRRGMKCLRQFHQTTVSQSQPDLTDQELS